MADIRRYIAENQWSIFLVILIVGFSLWLMFSHSGARKSPSEFIDEDEAAVLPQDKYARVANGYDWQEVNTLKISNTERALIKNSLLKLSVETSYLCGNPIIEPSASIEEYTLFVDRFYGRAENLDVPIFFAVKMVDMAKQGRPKEAIDQYKKIVLQKLRETDLIE
jgi:hypothetical protein